jgi:hypothetical protein
MRSRDIERVLFLGGEIFVLAAVDCWLRVGFGRFPSCLLTGGGGDSKCINVLYCDRDGRILGRSAGRSG